MANISSLLVIKVSPRGEHSGSRKLADEFLTAWKNAHPDGRVVVQDLSVTPPPLMNEAWIAGAYSPTDQHSPEARAAIRVSDTYVDELLAASEVVIATPTYNFGIPGALKLWIDQIVRAGRTFSFGANGADGLARGRSVKVLVTSSGDFRPGQPLEAMNFVEPYLRCILGFIGITQVDFVYAHNQSRDGGEAILTEALATARALAAAV
jgi:FMN-dependent NADH-azoreductase